MLSPWSALLAKAGEWISSPRLEMSMLSIHKNGTIIKDRETPQKYNFWAIEGFPDFP